MWDFIQRLDEAATVIAFDLQLTAESTDGLQHVEYSGALDAGYTASAMKAAADKLQEIVGAGALRMTVGSLGFATGQALLDWLKATNQPFDASKGCLVALSQSSKACPVAKPSEPTVRRKAPAPTISCSLSAAVFMAAAV